MFYSLIDALGISAGFLLALVTIGGIRELLGTGQIVVFGQMIVSIPMMSPASYMILPPGAFLTIGILMAIINYSRAKKLARGE
jgi:electron transport complex protein RnfE